MSLQYSEKTGTDRECSCRIGFGIDSFTLHILAMLFMLCDHLWATVIPGNMWLTNIGRMAYPIFAFMLVEGYFHTRNVWKYMARLLIAAVISEIPFNLMYGGTVFYPYHQNILWTLLLSLLCITTTEELKIKSKTAGRIAGPLIFAAGAVAAFAGMLDYYGYGVLTVGVFYIFYGEQWWNKVLQIMGLYIINVLLMGGMTIDVNLFGHTFEIVQQGIAVFSMIPILLYNKRKGPDNKLIRFSFYAFYPLHMLILSLLALR